MQTEIVHDPVFAAELILEDAAHPIQLLSEDSGEFVIDTYLVDQTHGTLPETVT